MPPIAEQQLARAIYKELIESRSGYTTGNTTEAAELVAARLKREGFAASDIFLGGAIPKKGNVVVRYRGSNAGKKPILLLAHLDVVEAKREDWSMEPYQLIEKDGYFYGRGTLDDKAQAAIWVANLIRYKREGFRPDRDLILALTADEEGGGPYNGVEWLLKNHRDLIEAEYCLNEGGWGELDKGRRISNNVQLSEKWVLNLRLEVRNAGGHSSMPVAENAIYRLSEALSKISKSAFPFHLNEVTRSYFGALAKTESGSWKADLEKVPAGDEEAMKRIAASSPAWNATLRTTCVATQLEGGHAMNALPQLAAATVNCRVLPDENLDGVKSTLERVIADPQVKISVIGEPKRGPASPLREDLMKVIRRFTDTMWPSVPVIPIMVMGGTDGAYLRAAGIPTYGVQGIFLERDDFRAHGRDERLLVKSFYEGQTFLYQMVKALTSN